MTKERLEELNQIDKSIEELYTLKRLFSGGNTPEIYSNGFSDGSAHFYRLDKETIIELNSLIQNYCTERIKLLKQKLEEA